MTAEDANPRSWRPQVLAFSADPRRRERLLTFASWLEGASGLTAAVQIVVGEGAVKRKERQEQQELLEAQIARLQLDVHGRAVLAPDAMEALPVIVQSFGLGPLKANTVLFGWPEETEEHHLVGYAQAVREIYRLGVNVVSMLSDEHRWGAFAALPLKNRRIDVWWQGDDASRLALLTAYLFTRTAEWSRSSIRIIGVAEAEVTREAAEQELRTTISDARIPADVQCIVTPQAVEIAEISAGAAFVFVPTELRRGDFVGPFGLKTADVLARLPMSAAVIAGAPFDLVAGPETKEHAKLRAVEERIQVAAQRLRTLEHQRPRLESELEARRKSPDAAAEDIDAAELRLQTLDRRILSTRAKLDAARLEMDALSTSRNDAG